MNFNLKLYYTFNPYPKLWPDDTHMHTHTNALIEELTVYDQLT